MTSRRDKELQRLKICAFVAFLGILGIGMILMANIERMQHDAALVSIENDGVQYAKQLTRQIDEEFQALNSISKALEYIDIDSDKRLGEVIESVSKENDYSSLTFFDLEGEGLSYVKELDEVIGASMQRTSREVEHVFKKALNGDESVECYFDEEAGERLFVYGTPVYKNDSLAGCIIAAENIGAYVERLEEKKVLSGNGYLHLLENDGTYLVRALQQITDDTSPNFLEQKYLDEGRGEEIKLEMEKNEIIHDHMHYNGNEYLYVLVPMERFNWYLACVNTTEFKSMHLNRIANQITMLIVGALTITFIVFVCLYISYFNKNKKELHKLYHHEELEIENKQYFMRELGNIKNFNGKHMIICVRIESFSLYRDVHGVNGANLLIKKTYKSINEDILPLNAFMCYGSNGKFYVCIEEENTEVIYERIARWIERFSKEVEKEDKYIINIKCGISFIGEKDNKSSFKRILHQAKMATREGKETSYTGVYVYDWTTFVNEKVNRYIQNNMYKAIENGDFQIYLQPKVNLKNYKVEAAEALVRWKTEDGSLIMPNQFIPIFEENGFCFRLDMYILDKACSIIKDWLVQGNKAVPLAVNISRTTIYHVTIAEDVRKIIEKYKIDPSYITIEVIESRPNDDLELLKQRMTEIRALGVKVSMDDFGSGYSSLGALGQLAEVLDEVKLDKSFLKAIQDYKEEPPEIVMEGICQMMKNLHLNIVAEGVENEEMDLYVRNAGIEFGQGYYYDRPLTVENFQKAYIKHI